MKGRKMWFKEVLRALVKMDAETIRQAQAMIVLLMGWFNIDLSSGGVAGEFDEEDQANIETISEKSGLQARGDFFTTLRKFADSEFGRLLVSILLKRVM